MMMDLTQSRGNNVEAEAEDGHGQGKDGDGPVHGGVGNQEPGVQVFLLGRRRRRSIGIAKRKTFNRRKWRFRLGGRSHNQKLRRRRRRRRSGGQRLDNDYEEEEGEYEVVYDCQSCAGGIMIAPLLLPLPSPPPVAVVVVVVDLSRGL